MRPSIFLLRAAVVLFLHCRLCLDHRSLRVSVGMCVVLCASGVAPCETAVLRQAQQPHAVGVVQGLILMSTCQHPLHAGRVVSTWAGASQRRVLASCRARSGAFGAPRCCVRLHPLAAARTAAGRRARAASHNNSRAAVAVAASTGWIFCCGVCGEAGWSCTCSSSSRLQEVAQRGMMRRRRRVEVSRGACGEMAVLYISRWL